MKVDIFVSFKQGVLDPQAKAVSHALEVLGFDGIQNLSISKRISLDIDCGSREEATKLAKDMCERLLANTVIEEYEIVL